MSFAKLLRFKFNLSLTAQTALFKKYGCVYLNKLLFKGIISRNCSHTGYSPVQNFDTLSSPQIHVETVPSEIKVNKNGHFSLEGYSLQDLNEYELRNLKQKFNIEKLCTRHMTHYGVKVGSNKCTLCFPLNDKSNNITAAQFLKYDETSNEVEKTIFPKETSAAVFGWSVVPETGKEIVITSHCLDAIAVNQEVGIPSVAVHFNDGTFPNQVLSFFERFSKIYLWFSAEYHHWTVHKLFAEKFGKKTFLVRSMHNPFTPLSCLKNGYNLKLLLNSAISLKHDAVETFSSFKDATYAEFADYEKCSGTKWKRFPVLNELLKGLRKGELTVFSGQTGTGKTTFMSEYSLDLCMQGLPTLWGSFEVTNTRLLKTMLTQFSLCPLKDCPEKFHCWATEFDKLPIFFMNFNGHHSMKAIIEAMTHTVLVYSIQHIIIDNLQFMMNIEDFNSSVDQIRRQDQVFAVFRNFACQNDCHITLVMHPRKEPEFTELNNNSISGSAKATQEADNILLLQTTKNRQYLEVTKNRFDGEKGCVLLEFNKETLTFKIKKIVNRFVQKPTS